MRSTSLQMRSTSAQISCVSVRSKSVTLAFEQLRRASDAGERVLDFMGEHGGEAGDRARGAAMGELTLDHLRHAALLQHDQHASRRLGHRAAVEIDELRRIEAVTSRDRRHIR